VEKISAFVGVRHAPVVVESVGLVSKDCAPASAWAIYTGAGAGVP
jgi:hypothetical protein